MAAVGKARFQQPVHAPGDLAAKHFIVQGLGFQRCQEGIAAIGRAPGPLGKVAGIVPAAVHGFLLLPVKAHHIRMADAMDTRDLIAAALVPVEVEGCLQGTVPDILSDAERLRHSPAILDGIGSGPRPVAEIQPGKRNVPVREQRRRTGKDGSPLFILQDERIRLRSRRKGDFGIGRTIPGMGERDLPFRDIPAFVMVRLNLLQFQPVKVNGHVLLPDRAVEACRSL